MSSPTLEEQVLQVLNQKSYQPIKPKALARKLNVSADDYPNFRQTLKSMLQKGKIDLGKKNVVRLASTHRQVIGVFRSVRKGGGFVRPRPGQGKVIGDIFIKAKNAGDAASGDVVLVAVVKFPTTAMRSAEGRIVEIVERAASHFVGTYFTDSGEGFVRVDGGVFHEPIYVGDPGAKGARDGDKVVFEMLRFPSPEMTGEGVITEVLGPRGAPGVDLLSIVRQFRLPDEFEPAAIEDARAQARVYEQQGIGPDRLDLTNDIIITIDPADARDFDDAISLTRDDKGFWKLGVHIADVAAFVRPGSPLDHEAKRRGTSVYLPAKVLPMLPELISNGLASLQEGRVRYTKTAYIEFDPEGRITATDFHNSAIKVAQRFTYETVMDVFNHPENHAGKINDDILGLLARMRELYLILRARRRSKGLLELSMPEAILDYDENGKIVGAHYAVDDDSHRVIEEFMVTANEAVASKLHSRGIAFLRRVHEIPDPLKLKSFSEFARSLGIKIEDYRSRYELQKVLKATADRPEKHAIHYGLLRSLKEAVYAPEEEGHFALASDCYCHFTSPIRRYPDLVVHRLLDQLIRTGKAGSDHSELVVLGEHCSFTERRAAKAERELKKLKLLDYLAGHVGEEMTMVITGVEEFGFFAQGVDFPAEGLVHVRTLTDDFYQLDRATHSLVGQRVGRRYRLGDKIQCVVWNVDQEQRELDLRLAQDQPKPKKSFPEQRKKRGKKEK